MNKRMLVDTSMLFVFLLLLDYRYVHNFGHEMLALVFTALFLLHTIWNAGGTLPSFVGAGRSSVSS